MGRLLHSMPNISHTWNFSKSKSSWNIFSRTRTLSECSTPNHWFEKWFSWRRTAATHILVIMISTEACSKKPYALPVQCISYTSLKDNELRGILNVVIKQMVDSEWRLQGNALMENGTLCGAMATLALYLFSKSELMYDQSTQRCQNQWWWQC